ncbi:hypothetical protein HSX37_01665|uniref:Uncharacterized protein n=1 Tax=Dendrosporobacter quercicolus TaxID=146817 RepID=A0A1G9LMM1_9FIRM|nr:hypothetical protein [Dendrosporobacter quercicolus]NSL46763.1 hypothetical protein [Dendrosporobacter quercicolus DSM 1736]SDL63158.1 hypothetical protein SAMN04488502_101401 [Dendrosporobacter quercicolus]
MDSLATLLLLCIGIACSIGFRIYRYREISGHESKASPLSLAIQEIVAVSGGVYLSLVMLTSFLKLDIPARITLSSIAIDPLALTAICLAMIQPLFFKFIK